MSGLLVDGVTVRYGTGRRALTAVDRVTLAVPPGAAVGLVGESGSGKSTLARALVGLAPLHGGRVTLGGDDLTPARRRRIQLVFQDPYASLNPRMTAGDAVAEAVATHGRMSTADRAAEVARLLALVRLDPLVADRYPRELSGGQRQRVALARALGARPELLVADEITSALDVSVQGAVLNLIRDLRSELGLSLLLVSHNLAVVRYVCDVIAVMHLGQIVEVAPTERLVENPRHPYTRALLAAVPSLGAPLGADGDAVVGADPPDPHDPPAGCRFHPRCPVGPLVRPERAVCKQNDPSVGSADRPHRSSCHFVEE